MIRLDSRDTVVKGCFGDLGGNVSGLVRRPVIGALLFGLIVGGTPFGIAFSRLSGQVVSLNTLGLTAMLTPVAVVVATVGALLGGAERWHSLLSRAFFASLGACLPVPTFICGILVFHDLGPEGFFDPRKLPGFALVFGIWAGVVTIYAWLLALAFVFL